jgi:hypothetical protein
MYQAKIILFGPEQDGRLRPPITGPTRSIAYRPALQVGKNFTTCFLFTDQTQILEFGKEFEVTLELLFPEQYECLMFEGMLLNFFEGTKQVGHGVLLGINKDQNAH